MSDLYPPRPGGLEAHVARLARHLTARNHEVDVATVGANGPRHDPSGVCVHEFGLSLERVRHAYRDGRPFHPPWVDRRFSRSLLELASRLRPEVIHAHGWSVFSAAFVGDRLGVPVVATLHDYGLLCPTKSLSCNGVACRALAGLCCVRCSACDQGLAKRTGLALALRAGRRAMNQRVSRFIAVSTYVAKRHLERGVGDEDTLSVIPNFVDLVDRDPAPAPVHGPILFVGPDATYKGSRLTRCAYAQLPLAERGGLHLVGGTPAPAEGDVLRLGRRSGEALWRSYRSASLVAVTPAWPDPCPTVALEAMALGRAVVATAVGGLTDIISDRLTGLLVPPQDTIALATAFRTVLDDPAAAQRMGQAARTRVAAQFSAEAVVPQIEQVYSECQT